LAALTVWTGFRVDRSERERSLSQENVDRLASIVESSSDAIIGKTITGVITSWNPAAEIIYGYSAQEIIGQPVSTIIPASRREEFETILEKIRQGQRISHYETERLRKDGQTVFVSLSVSPLKDKTGTLAGVSTITRDITERKRTEAALQESEAKFRSLSDLVPQFVWVCTPDGLSVYFNQRWVEYTGLSLEESYGRGWNTPFHPDDKQAAWDAWNHAVATGDTYRVESRLRAGDGRYRWFLMRGVPLRDASGSIVKWFGTCTDIDDLKQAEDALRRASLYTRSLIEASLDPLVTISRDGKITDVNQATETVTGVSREHLIGSDFSTYFTQPEKARRGYEQVFAEGKVTDYELAIRHTSGRVANVLYNASVFKNEAGEIEGVFAAARDITRRKQIEDELRLSRERLAMAQKAGHCGTFDWDMQNNINYWSTEVEEVYGIAPGEFGGTYEDWEALVVPEDLVLAKKGIEESIRTGEFAGEWRIRRRNDGEIRWITARAKLVFDDNGKPQRMLGLNMDVTERKRAEEEVRRLNQELEQRVIQRTVQLEASNKELEAFTYSVSHDLRAPLRHISGFSKILTEEFGSNLPPAAQHHVQRIQEGTRRMGLLVDDLLNLARVGRRDLSFQTASLKSITNEVIADLVPECVDRQIEWKIGTLPFVECDPALMKQVFQNLLSNAVKFTRPRSQAVIEIGQKDEDGSAVVFVRDNGVGFNMKYCDKLFGVFQRLHRPEDFEGTGVGLATVQRIIQKHGGRIWAEAELDKGATFYFTLGTSEKTELKTKTATAGDKP
jgi:PAS domain S-box-containing protein